MSAPVVAFFNGKAATGNTTLLYHLAWKFADMGMDVLAVDADPQADLTAAFLPSDECEALWALPAANRPTIYGAVEPMRTGSDFRPISSTAIAPKIRLLAGDLDFSLFEDELARSWSDLTNDRPQAASIASALHRLIRKTSELWKTDVVLVDAGPSLGARARATVLAADYVVVPVAADVCSVQALRNTGQRMRSWRQEWESRRAAQSATGFALPPVRMEPAGYVLIQHRHAAGQENWARRIPFEYDQHVSGGDCLATVRHYLSLMPMAHEARKPIFHLTAADGAIGAHYQAAQAAGAEFAALAARIASRIGLSNR